MELSQRLEGEVVRLVDIDGDTVTAQVTDYVYPEDNEPEGISSIIIWDAKKKQYVEYLETEIKSVEVIGKGA